MGNLGSCLLTSLGDYQRAIDFDQQSLAIKREIGNHGGEATSLANLGNAYDFLGEYQRAIDFHRQSLVIYRQIGNRGGEAASLANLGVAYYSLGEYQRAIDFHQQSLAIVREIGDLQGEAKSLGNLGNAYDSLGEYQRAIDLHQQALIIAQEIDDKYWIAGTLNNLGNSYKNLGRYQRAIDFHQQSLAIGREIGDLQGEANSLGSLGLTYYSLGDYQHAIDFLQQTLAITQYIGDAEGEGLSLSYLGYAQDKFGKTDLAITFFKQSVNKREGIRSGIQGLSSELQESYTQTVAGTYRKLADLLIDRGRIAEAQQVLELLKLQELNDFTRGTRSADKLPEIGLNKAEKQIKTKHGTLISFGLKYYNCEQNNCPQFNTYKTQYQSLSDEFYQLVEEIKNKVAENRKTKVAEDTDDFTASADKIVTAYPNSVLIYPLVLPDKVRLLWAAKGGVLADKTCEISESKLNQLVNTFQELVETPTSNIDQIKTTGKQLYDCLVQPLEAELKANNIRHLVFAPDRITNYIPFAALFDGEQFLIQRFQVTNILNAGLTNVTEQLPTDPEEVQVLGLGFSQAKQGFAPLKHVPAEIDSVVKHDPKDPKGIAIQEMCFLIKLLPKMS